MTPDVVEGPVTEPKLTAVSRELLTYGTLDLAPTAPRVNSFAEVLAGIEAAARAEVIAEIRVGVEGLPRELIDDSGPIGANECGGVVWAVGFKEVLALLPPTADRAEPVGLREARSDALDSAIAIVQQSLDSSRYEAGSNPDKTDLMVIAAREHIIKLLTHYRDRIATDG